MINIYHPPNDNTANKPKNSCQKSDISKEESPHQDKTLFSSVDNNMKLDSFTILLKMFWSFIKAHEILIYFLCVWHRLKSELNIYLPMNFINFRQIK